MSINSSQSLIRDLLANMAHGQPFGLQELAAHQVSPSLAAKYVSSRRLETHADGVYAFPNDTLQ